jgi:hypothetical protein
MLKGSALFIVIIISFVIGILCTSLVFISYFQRFQVQTDLRIKRLDANSSSGINLLLSSLDMVGYGEENTLDLFGEERDSVYLKRISWGIFDIGIAKAFSNQQSNTKIAQYGYKPTKYAKSAIYLTDQNRPLSLAGNTLIKGDCYLPLAGIRKGYIEGQSYSRDELVFGEKLPSGSTLPAMNPQIIDRLKAYLSRGKKILPQEGDVNVDLDLDTLNRSFLENSLMITSNGGITLENKIYSGQVIIHSSKSVTIKASAVLDNILIFAPYIFFEDEFKGKVQAYASDSLIVGKKCSFNYPSVLGLLKLDQPGKQPFIHIGEETLFKGIVFTYSELDDLEQTLVKLEKETELEGQVIVNGFVEIYGQVFGNVSCNRFRLKTLISSFDNHLFNTTIDYTKLSPHFVGSELWMAEKERKVVAWLE